MRTRLSWCLWAAAGAALLLVAPMHGWQREMTSRPGTFSGLYARRDPAMRQTSVSGPQAAVRHAQGPTAETALTASVNIAYNAEFPANARIAFQAAVDVWATQITSPVPITISANWVPTTVLNLSEGASANDYRNFPNAPFSNTWYSAALANKLAGRDLDPASSDIVVRLNSNRSDWYFGTDGIPPPFTFDFETAALNALTNGLGLTGTATDNGQLGSIGRSGSPAIYDRFVEDVSRRALLDTTFFPNPSVALHNVLTSDGPRSSFTTFQSPDTGIYWNGANGVAAAPSGTRPRLEAQSPWTDFCNYVSLNDVTYPRGDVNSLMTCYLDSGESVHLSGPIVLGMLLDLGFDLACNYTLSATSATVPLSGGTVVVGITVAPPCAWTASAPAGSFVTFPNGNSGKGNGTLGLSVAPATAARSTTLTIAGQPFVVTQTGDVPPIATDRATLRFGAVNNSGTLSQVTSPQTVAVDIPSSSGAAWTAGVATASPWLKVTNGTGTGSGAFTVSIQSDPSLTGQTSVTGTITVNAAGAAATIKTITVVLTLFRAAASTAPLGALDTPAEGSTNSGSVAVTGWALDDIEVVKVQILRDAHPNDPPGAALNGRVFIGDAAFVEGARPDVEAASASPMNYRGGWGYLMLTRGLIWDGKGPFKIYVVATDREGNTTQIGSKTITIDNSGATKPFGAIDTPGPGATISGTYPNTGWVLTPFGTTTGSITASGVQVYIDGVLVPGTPSMSSRSDVSAAFPTFNTGQAGRGLFIDTTKYANGTHTIGWLVTDSLGNADGVGSRFFKIQNSGQVTTTSQLINQPATMLRGIDNGAAVLVATSVDPKARRRTVRPDAFGRRHVRIAELDPVVVRQVNGDAAYLVANGQLRALPLGAAFDAKTGTFFWQTSAGYVGDYEFVVVDESRRDARRLTRLVVSVGRTPAAFARPTN
jgi:hypothetical protein